MPFKYGLSPCEFMHDLFIGELYRPADIFIAADRDGLFSFTSTLQ